MERVREKMEEVIQKQKRLQEQSQAKTESRSAIDKSQFILAIGGVAAGLTLAVIVWLAKSIVMTDHLNMSAADRDVALHRGEFIKLSDNIAHLNERVGSLTESVSNLEAKLMRVIGLTDSITNIEKKHAFSFPQQMPESADSSAIQISTETEEAFNPSHIVKARVNLRPSASLHTTPIAVLNIGTEVEYISKSDGWFYVNTQSHGKGWCSSDHLSPLLSTQRKSPPR